MESERRICRNAWDKFVAQLAARQHGVVAARQLAALGISRNAISARAQAGRLHRVHHGVYAVGHTILTVNGRRMAAVLAAGPGAVLSATLPGRALERALDESEGQGLYDLTSLSAMASAHAGERGAARLQQADRKSVV